MANALNRRELFQTGAVAAIGSATIAADAVASPLTGKQVNRRMHLGIVTYNVAKDWDLDTILKNCKTAGVEGVEFRTTHAHGVEPSLNAEQRAEIRRKCGEASLLQVSLGTVCEFQSPDASIVR